MSAYVEILVAIRPPMPGEVPLSLAEIEIGARENLFPIISMVTKVRTKADMRTLQIVPSMATP